MPFICQRKFIITSWNGWICETAAHNGQNNKQNLFRERCVCGVVGSVSPFVQSTSTEREIEGINMHCPDSGASHINRNQFTNEMIYEPCILVTLHLCGYLLHVVLLFCFSFLLYVYRSLITARGLSTWNGAVQVDVCVSLCFKRLFWYLATKI